MSRSLAWGQHREDGLRRPPGPRRGWPDGAPGYTRRGERPAQDGHPLGQHRLLIFKNRKIGIFIGIKSF